MFNRSSSCGAFYGSAPSAHFLCVLRSLAMETTLQFKDKFSNQPGCLMAYNQCLFMYERNYVCCYGDVIIL